MKHAWQVWLAFALCLAIVILAMGWLTSRSMQLDRAEALAREQLEQEIDVKLAVLRMDAMLTPLLAQEAMRNSRGTTTSTATLFTQSTPHEFASSTLSSHVLLNFEFVDGQWSSPQVSQDNFADEPNSRQSIANPSEQVQIAASRLDDLRRSSNPTELLSVLPDVTYVANVATNHASYRLDQQPIEASNSLYGQGRDASQPHKSATSLPTGPPQIVDTIPRNATYSSFDDNQRALKGVAAKGQKELEIRNQTLNALTQSIPNQMQQASTLANMDDPDRESTTIYGDSRALWHHDRLLYVRQARINGRVGIRGSWLDWPEIKRLLLEQVSDLVPIADLVAVNDETSDKAFSPGRALAALPAQIALPPTVIGDMPWTPIRVSLAAVWGCLALAATAIAGLLWGILRLSDRRAAFVAAVTHELRTPLTTFKMYSEMLADGMVKDEKQTQSYLETLKTEADRLIHLVDNVLSYARLERGRRVARHVNTTAGAVLDLCQRRLQNHSQVAGTTLIVNAEANARQTRIITDPAVVEQILFNLVDNACKYGQNDNDNCIHITLRNTASFVTFQVADKGRGLSVEAQRDLFRPFSKSVEVAAQTAPGVGLGLALCHRLAMDLNGRLTLSNESPGTVFCLELPVNSSSPNSHH